MTPSKGFRSGPAHLIGAVCLAALAVGLVADQLTFLPIGLLTLLPGVSHARWVGLRNALTEPNAATVIVIFYLFVFPLRGLVIAATGFTDVQFDPFPITASDLIAELALASLGTAAIIESFHFVRRSERLRFSIGAIQDVPPPVDPLEAHGSSASMSPDRRGLLYLAVLLSAPALLGLLLLLAQYHGLGGVQAQFLSHAKIAGGNKSSSYRLWTVLAVPAVWCLSAAAIRGATSWLERALLGGAAALLVVAQIVAFGARLDAVLALLGVWTVFHYSGLRLSPSLVLVGLLVTIGLSIPILSARPGGSTLTSLPVYEQVSQISSYGILDAALTVNQNPGQIEAQMSASTRWLNSPLYLVPSFLWPNKPTIDGKTMDVFVAKTIGNFEQQNTGFPTSYLTEQLLYGGWLLVLLVSVLFGALLGWLHVRLLEGRQRRPPPAALIWQAFVLEAAFTYYKDGDVLQTAVGEIRTAFYLGAAMLVTGVWSLRSGLGAWTSKASQPGGYSPL